MFSFPARIDSVNCATITRLNRRDKPAVFNANCASERRALNAPSSRRGQSLFECRNEVSSLRRKCAAFKLDDSVDSFGKVFLYRDHFQALASCQANVHDDWDSQREFDIAFDDFPSSHLEANLI